MIPPSCDFHLQFYSLDIAALLAAIGFAMTNGIVKFIDGSNFGNQFELVWAYALAKIVADGAKHDDSSSYIFPYRKTLMLILRS